VARRKFSPSLFKYHRRAGDTPEGYTYQGDKPFTFKRADGKSQTVQPGAEVSSRQYQNLRYQAAGWKSKSQYESLSDVAYGRDASRKLKRRGFPHEAGAWRQWSIEYALEHDQSITKVRQPDSKFSQLFAAALADDFGPDSEGAFADLLVGIGWRDEGDTWDVGETDVI
jgi:hypothetical protein